MNFEVLKRSYLKRNILIGVLVVAVISACVLTFTRAKYRTIQSIKIAEGQINYKIPDFNMVSLYIANGSGEYVEADTIPSSGYALNTEQSYCGQSQDGKIMKDNTVNILYNNGSVSISNLTKKGTKCYLYFDEYEAPRLLANAILEGKSIQTRNDFSTILANNTNGIIYRTNDNDGTTYYFAGNTDENWVRFGGYYWRIIRINGDGSIRMIYTGEDEGSVQDANRSGDSTLISLDGNTRGYQFNEETDLSEYVGLQYTIGNQHGNTANNDMLNILNTWYLENIPSSSQGYIDNTAWFCSDRDMASEYNWNGPIVRYAAWERLITNKEPTLQCNNVNDQLKLSNGVGLITADEAAFAGFIYVTVANQSCYLFTSRSFWTMTPAQGDNADVFVIFGNATLYAHSSSYSYGVRPVINLKSDTLITGDGTSSNPYTVEGAT